MADLVPLRGEYRDVKLKSEVRRLRRQGSVPAVLYGKKQDPRPIQIAGKDLEVALRHHGHSALFDLTVNGERTPAVIKELQHDPVTGRLSHLGIQRVSLEETITANVRIQFVGDTKPLTDAGAVIQHTASEVTISCRADQLPEVITLDLSGLGVGQSLRIADLTPPEGVTFLSNPEQVVVATSISAAAREGAGAEETPAPSAPAEEQAPGE